MTDWPTIIEQLESDASDVVERAYSELLSRSKCSVWMESFHGQGGFDILFGKFIDTTGRSEQYSSVLSVLGDCFYVSALWRSSFFEKDGISVLADHLYKQTNNNITCKLVRMLGNLTDNYSCLRSIQNNSFLLRSIVKHGICKNMKTQLSCLRTLRKVCTSKHSARYVADDDQFPTLLLFLYSTNIEVVMLCLKLICSLLKTQIIEVCHRAIENEILMKILQLAKESLDQNIKNICIEILYLITLNSACRVTVASAGALQIFIDRIKSLEFDDFFKYATRGLCLCSREAVNRNKMKLAGALSALVDVLKNDRNDEFRESIVASFVWFLFDDKSLALLIRAEVVPALLTYIDDLTVVELRARLKSKRFDEVEETDSNDVATSSTDSKDGLPYMPLSDSMSLAYNENPAPPTYVPENSWESPSSRSQLLMTSPETSPYYPDSPQYSLPSYSPPLSPDFSSVGSPPRYSPPHSPPMSPPQFSPQVSSSQFSPEYQGDGYFSDTDSSSSMFKKVPYHFQSADGIHAMIHGTRGPIHDTLLLLSRFSQAKDPSSFFLLKEGFNSLLNYILISPQPNQKCARILNRLTLNSHCFDVMVKKRLIPNLYLRLCTGHSLEHLTLLLARAKENYSMENVDSSDEESMSNDVNLKTLFRHIEPTPSVLSLGKLLISNLRSQCESSYGKGVLSHIMLTGSKALKESCVLSIPYVIWSASLLKRVFLDFNGVKILVGLISEHGLNDDELFIMVVESICSLARSVVDNNVETMLQDDGDINDEIKTCQLAEDNENPPPMKKLKTEQVEDKGKDVIFILPSNEKVKVSKRLLSENSLFFERMFSTRYDTCKETSEIFVNDINEIAFKKFIHFIHGCTVKMNSNNFCSDLECKLLAASNPGERVLQQTDRPHDDLNYSHSDLNSSSLRLVTHSSVTNVMHLYACAERYFLNELKSNCRDFMMKVICEKTLLPIMLLAYRHSCVELQRHCLMYLLTKMNSPRDRVQAFAEIVLCEEKKEFLNSVHHFLMESIKTKKR